MFTRWLAALLCLLYLSASSVLSAVHHHDASLQGDQQCAACAWHHESSADTPEVPPLVIQPQIVFFIESAVYLPVDRVVMIVHPSRGPPVTPLS